MVNTNVDVLGISHFILTRLLNNPDIASQFAHPTVPHLYKPGIILTSKFQIKCIILILNNLQGCDIKMLIICGILIYRL